MSAKRGIKEFGQQAIAAMIKEFCQLDEGAFPGKPVVKPIDPNSITAEEEKDALEAISLIKQKRSGVVKGRMCANGSKQRQFLGLYESVASPTISLEAILATLIIDAYEGRSIAVFDVPGAYLHAPMLEGKCVIMRIRGDFMDMMIQANEKYADFVKIVKGKKALYLKVLRAIYGCIQSALLWYEMFSGKLEKMGFQINPYDCCVANKTINGHQCSIVWYVDDVKVLHVQQEIIKDVITELEKEFGD